MAIINRVQSGVSGARRLLIFTDLDGTLLDHYSYSAEAARGALQRIDQLKIPWIPATSKTFAELLPLRQQLNHQGVFIIENGAAIYIPENLPYAPTLPRSKHPGYRVRVFGTARPRILEILRSVAGSYRFTGFAQMSSAELSACTGLDAQCAEAALAREYSEPLLWQDSEASLAALTEQLSGLGLRVQRGGRFVHLMGAQDKAQALRWLCTELSRESGESWVSVALGDGENDLAMLAAADIPVVVRSPVNPLLRVPGRPDARTTQACGPQGWSQAVQQILDELGYALRATPSERRGEQYG